MPREALSILDHAHMRRTRSRFRTEPSARWIFARSRPARRLRTHDLRSGLHEHGLLPQRITFIDGDQGILRYRGYPIEQLAEKCTFLEVAYLILNGELPTEPQLKDWVGTRSRITP